MHMVSTFTFPLKACGVELLCGTASRRVLSALRIRAEGLRTRGSVNYGLVKLKAGAKWLAKSY